MRKVMLFLLIFFIIGTPFLYAQSSGTGANFLKIGVGPRAIGLGSTFTGIGDDVYTLYWNPAGIGFIRRWELSAMYNNYFADMHYGALSGVKQYEMLGSRKTGFGFGIFYHDMPDWNATDNPDAPQASASNILGLISFGQRLDWLLDDLSIGINAKIGYSKLMTYNSTTYATDLGIMYRFEIWDKPLMLGLAAQNIGYQEQFIKEKAPIPTGFRLGASYRILGCPWHHLLIATDLSKYKYGNYKLGFGAEYWFRDIVGFRGGYNYNQDDLGDISFGASVRVDAFNSGIQTDYSQTDFGDVLGFDKKGAVSVHTVSPEPFYLLEPDTNECFCENDAVILKWEAAEDPDYCDVVSYRVLVDTDRPKIIESIKSLRKDHKLNAATLVDLATTSTQLQLPFLPGPITYHWTVIAFDQAGHSYDPGDIRPFTVWRPDLQIAEFKFLPNTTLPGLAAYDQGKIKIVINNNTSCSCPAGKFKVVVTDSFPCHTDQDSTIKVYKSFYLDGLRAGASRSEYLDWTLNQPQVEEGQHFFHVDIDTENEVVELDENNNEADCEAITIPRGRILASTEHLKTKKIVFEACQIPLIPLVFFDYNSARIDSSYFIQTACEPIAVLKVLADRLRENADISVKIFGYIDPVSEADVNQKLARDRAENVMHTLVEMLNVPANQVEVAKDYTLTEKRLDRTPTREVNEENRRVEVKIDNANMEKERRLFGPENICVNDALRDGLVFDSELHSFSGCSAWQLVIRDKSASQIITNLPFGLSRYQTVQEDTIAWVGNDRAENLVPVNTSYLYTMKVQDKVGRWFETKPQQFYIDTDSMIFVQERHIFPMEFNQNTSIFSFYEDEMVELAKIFIKDTTYHAIILYSTCPIGTMEGNTQLVTVRKRSRDKFIDIIDNILAEQYGRNYDKTTYLNPVLVRIDPGTVQFNLPAKNIAGLTGVYGPRLKYYSPCCCYHDIFYGDDNTPLGRNYNRRIEVVLYKERKDVKMAEVQ